MNKNYSKYKKYIFMDQMTPGHVGSWKSLKMQSLNVDLTK
jgi:hypothetical protein